MCKFNMNIDLIIIKVFKYFFNSTSKENRIYYH